MRLYRDPESPGRLDFDRDPYRRIAQDLRARRLVHEHIVPIRSGYAWPVTAGSVARLVTLQGPPGCGPHNWDLNKPPERFLAAPTRQLPGAPLTTLDPLWSRLPPPPP